MGLLRNVQQLPTFLFLACCACAHAFAIKSLGGSKIVKRNAVIMVAHIQDIAIASYSCQVQVHCNHSM